MISVLVVFVELTPPFT